MTFGKNIQSLCLLLMCVLLLAGCHKSKTPAGTRVIAAPGGDSLVCQFNGRKQLEQMQVKSPDGSVKFRVVISQENGSRVVEFFSADGKSLCRSVMTDGQMATTSNGISHSSRNDDRNFVDQWSLDDGTIVLTIASTLNYHAKAVQTITGPEGVKIEYK